MIKNNEGSISIMTALLLAFILIAFSALVIDAGYLYVERKSMVTAADAAALGGAEVLEKALADPTKDPKDVKGEAEAVAKKLALANGVKNEGDIKVDVICKNDPNFSKYNLEVIVVSVKNKSGLLFAKIFGEDSANVSAKAVATWGYKTKVVGGDILPIFIKSSDYVPNTSTYLHMEKVDEGNWGLIDVGSGNSAIEAAFSGKKVNLTMEVKGEVYNVDSDPGAKVSSIIQGIKERMIYANGLSTPEESKQYMSGLVPVIDYSKVKKNGGKLELPIVSFAVFEIQDYTIDNKSTGSPYAIYDTNYRTDNSSVNYGKVDGDYLKKSTILGRFTNDIPVAVWAVMQEGDQDSPDPNILSPTYAR